VPAVAFPLADVKSPVLGLLLPVQEVAFAVLQFRAVAPPEVGCELDGLKFVIVGSGTLETVTVTEGVVLLLQLILYVVVVVTIAFPPPASVPFPYVAVKLFAVQLGSPYAAVFQLNTTLVPAVTCV
jgi:hypothetical protein